MKQKDSTQGREVWSTTGISPEGEYTHALRLASELADLRLGYVNPIRATGFAYHSKASSCNLIFLALQVARAGSKALPHQTKGLDTRSSPFVWCGKRELNPYGKTTRPSNVRVCQFRHSRRTIHIITQKNMNVKHFFKSF